MIDGIGPAAGARELARGAWACAARGALGLAGTTEIGGVVIGGAATADGADGTGDAMGATPDGAPAIGGGTAIGGALAIGGAPRSGGGPAMADGPLAGGGTARAIGGGPLDGPVPGADARAILCAGIIVLDEARGATTTTLSQLGQRVSRPIIELSICDAAPQRGQPKTTAGMPYFPG